MPSLLLYLVVVKKLGMLSLQQPKQSMSTGQVEHECSMSSACEQSICLSHRKILVQSRTASGQAATDSK